MLAVQGMKKMKILKPGTLNPKVIKIVFESGNSVTVGCVDFRAGGENIDV